MTAIHLRIVHPDRPITRGDCEPGKGGAFQERPCTQTWCKWLSDNVRGSHRSDHVPPSGICILDVADNGPVTLDEVGAVLGVTRERIRQLEVQGLKKLRRFGVTSRALRDLSEHEFVAPRSSMVRLRDA